MRIERTYDLVVEPADLADNPKMRVDSFLAVRVSGVPASVAAPCATSIRGCAACADAASSAAAAKTRAEVVCFMACSPLFLYQKATYSVASLCCG